MKISTFAKRLSEALTMRDMTAADLSRLMNISDAVISQYRSGKYEPKQDRLDEFARVLDVNESWLMGYDVPPTRNNKDTYLPEPEIAERTVFLDVIGEIAAGYDSTAIENWSGEKVEIPESYLHGYPKEDFFVLKVQGQSMYPTYAEGDYVVIRKTPTLDYSGQVGAVIYEDECATLKRVEYVMGEDWMRLVPINPEYPPKMIRDEELEHCHIIGVPFVLIREIGQ